MKIRNGNFFVAAFIFIFILSLADSAQAQWKKVVERNDALGQVSYTEEEDNQGTVRKTDYFYFPETDRIESELITYKYRDGSKSVISRKYDKQKRIIAAAEKRFDAQNILVNGVRKRWTYRDANDTEGSETKEEIDPDLEADNIETISNEIPKENGFVGKWKVVDSWSGGEAKLIIEFREEPNGLAGYILEINDNQVKSLGFTKGELVYRSFRSVSVPGGNGKYAKGECRVRYPDVDANGVKTTTVGWADSGIQVNKFDQLVGGSFCVINQVDGNFRSKIVRIRVM